MVVKMKNVIHIYGASGSGTTTLGKNSAMNWASDLWIRTIIFGFLPIRSIPTSVLEPKDSA